MPPGLVFLLLSAVIIVVHPSVGVMYLWDLIIGSGTGILMFRTMIHHRDIAPTIFEEACI
jgi:hypothetical protein